MMDTEAMMSGDGFRHTESKLFSEYRTIGHISNRIPCLVRYVFKRRKNYIIGCTGRSFNTLESQQMRMLSTSPDHEAEISCMAADTYHVYTVVKKKIFAWRRGVELKHTYEGHEYDINGLLPIGEYLISHDDAGVLKMFNIVSEECKWTVEFPVYFFPTCIIHPKTYINKVLIGSSQGKMDLFNFNRVTSIHRFKGWGWSILAMAQSPYVDIIAACLSNKSIMFHHLKSDEHVMELKCIETPISLAFRSDRCDTLIVGGDKGSITVWNTTLGEMSSFKKDAHRGPVKGLQCFHQEPLFVTSAPDNTIQVWIFDMPDGGYRLYSNRSGHFTPSNRIRFYGSDGKNIASAGSDKTFRSFHIYNETYNRAISKAKIPLHQLGMFANSPNEEFMPEILDFTEDSVTDPDHHGSHAAIHADQANITTWSFKKMKRESVILVPAGDNDARSATSLCITSCGQFVIAGYDNGWVQRFNIQSGKHRMTYGSPTAHELTVHGVVVDQVNQIVATGGDNTIKFWKFNTGELIKSHELPGVIFTMFSHRVSGMIAVAMDTCSIVVLDIFSMNVFRNLAELSSPILCGCFSPDNRWLTVSTADGLIRTWDLSTSSLIDVFRMYSLVRSMDYSPTGDYLAMALHDSVGILVWTNKSLYEYLSLMPISPEFEPPEFSGGEDADEDEEMDVQEPEEGEAVNQVYESVQQIDQNITLSLLPPAKWKNLLNLDTIKMRNRPKMPPKTYVAPFFLSTLLGTPADGQNKEESEEPMPSTSRSSGTERNVQLLELSKFGKCLSRGLSWRRCERLLEMLASMSPTNIETEFMALQPLAGGSRDLLTNFLVFTRVVVEKNLAFEANEAYLALFLKLHGDQIRRDEMLLEALKELRKVMRPRDERLSRDVVSVLAFTRYIKSTFFL